METPSVPSTDAAIAALKLLLNFTQDPANVSEVQESFRDDLGLTGFHVTEAPVSSVASTLGTALTPAGLLSGPFALTEGPARLSVQFWDSPLSHGINVFVGFVLCFTMLGLGCTVEVTQLGAHIRRPVGVLLAAICQFVIMPLLAFLHALAFSLDDVAAIAVLLCGCCPGGNLSNIMSLLVNGDMNLSVIMTISSTLLALVFMPLCLWVYSRAWINTPVVDLLPFGAITLTLLGTLIPIGVGVALRYRYSRAADAVLKVSLWSLLVTLVMLFIMTSTMLGPELLATIPASVYLVAVFMPMAGYAAGYGVAKLFDLEPSSCRAVSMETGCQNVQLCTAILNLAFPPQLVGGMHMLPLLYALFQSAEAGIFILAYRTYRREVLHKQEPSTGSDHDTNITYKTLGEEDAPLDTAYGATASLEPDAIAMETREAEGSPMPV
ncbi:sodium/bile acid cotransporter 4 [Electrophorus electricus]|uniref:Sodium/bile acid cotransporter 4 n=1 Tax=Electrophorus electricus TaxID=8005 RepID=A0A4W4H5E5_ELEEL|nr:sodium/bile acid cotransporter 4 [Electrophorus electricus]